ncbi:LysM peptidoglycan-binding domain-containing protein [Streptomyces sp. LUP47B]|uniref:LysM peptidoglycan-binding domain-containing protein n=1 Tax=Streptomyces sp. LUP47B TaxID=1890286 RepID=UPI0008516F50|nr:LysM peptidoglycan-binding domain-containing protein [Streptomyces sp. LUP47B]
MRTALSPAATAGRTLARVLKAVLSLIVLAAAVAGLPLLLAWATPTIWGATHDDLTHLLDRQDTGAVFLLLLIAVGWIGWAQFAFCTVRELIAQLRGRTWRAPRPLGSSQRAAALLIGSILVLLPTSSALASDAQAAPATTAALTPGQATQAATAAEADHAPASAASTSSSPSLYTVREMRPAESLWGIAEKELGDGERWREIADLNEGRTMVDGHVFRANSFLQPGWQLEMPDTAGGVRTQLQDGVPAAGEKGEHVVTVHSGDYLSKIAEDELGDGDQWPRLFEASRDKPQPNGLPDISDPDVIYAGQQVTVPGAQPGQPPQHHDHGDESQSRETTPEATQKPDGEQTPGGSTGDGQAPAPSHTAAPAPQASAPNTQASRPAEDGQQDQASPPASASPTPGPSTSASPPATSPSESSSSATSSPPATASESPVPAPSSGPLNLRTVLGAGALLAAAITGALALRRTLQRRRRKPGEKIAIAAETSTAEAQLAAAAEPAGAARLDVALRTLAHRAAKEKDPALRPALRAARIGTRTVEVLPEDLSQEAQAPFVLGQAGWWILPPDAVLLDEEAAREMPAPYPGLVTVGTTEAHELVLLNLAQLPALLLDGNPVHISEVCTSLALELGMSPWASDVEVVTIGFGEDLPQLLPTARIAHMRQAAHALRDLSERLLEAHQMPETQHQPYLLLCASSLDADTAWQFADVIDKSGTVPVTLIAPASSAAAHFPEAEILNASLSEPQNLDYTGLDITVQRLEHAAYMQITTALKVSGQPSHPAEGPWQDVPDEPDTVQQPEPPVSEEPIAPTPAPPSPASAVVADVGSEVFPALLAATSDPAGLRLLPTTSAQADAQPGQDTATAPPAPEPVATAHTTGETAAEADDREDSAEESNEEREAHDLHAPEIRVLGPVEVTGVNSTGHGPRMAQLAALLFFRPGRSSDALCCDMDPVSPWSLSTLNARMQGLRRSLGNDPTGDPYVPRRKTGESPYRLSPAVRCDWTRFLQLAERALPLGPAGLTDLERALTLVRGRPFGGKPLPWAEPYQQEMITRIIDVAHTVATHRTPPGPHHDLSTARRAVATGLNADDTAELLYRDWCRIEAAAGNRQGLHTAITRIQQVNRTLDCSLETETEQLINELLNAPGPATPKALSPM